MKYLILLLLSFNVFAGEINIITHAGTIERNSCRLHGMILSDNSVINEYHIKCKSRIGYIPSVTIFEYNNISGFFYEDEELFCPIKKALIVTKKKFTLIIDCREWL